jgi:outer membrane protein, heavy metal efflux system
MKRSSGLRAGSVFGRVSGAGMPNRGSVLVLLLLALLPAGCVWENRRVEPSELRKASFQDTGAPPLPDVTPGRSEVPESVVPNSTLHTVVDFSGPRPVDEYIRRALAENRSVASARMRVLEMRHRIPQAVSLEDPMVQNIIWPFPSNGPQYSLMGYMPYETMISQQFPWFGTLKLRGMVADREARIALAELAAAQLDVVLAVKKAYLNLYAAERSAAILNENRSLATDLVELSRTRVANSGSQQDLLRAEIAVTQIDKEVALARQFEGEARADLAQQLHASPESEPGALPELPLERVPVEVDRLYNLAVSARPELQAGLAAIDRDEKAVGLARKRYYPQFTAGVAYSLMTRQNNPSAAADGHDNVGFMVGFNLPIYRGKLDAAVCEAKAKAASDAMKYEADRDRTLREVKEALVQSRAQREMLNLLESGILPKSEDALKLAASGYRNGLLDYVTLNTARQEWLQLQLQRVRLQAELGKAIAALERAVGTEINEHSPAAGADSALPPLPPADVHVDGRMKTEDR